MTMKIVPRGLNLEYLVKSKHLFEGNSEKISEILRVGSKPLIEVKIATWEIYNQQSVSELEILKNELDQSFSVEKVQMEIDRIHIYGKNVSKKDWANKLLKIEMDKFSVFISSDAVASQETTTRKRVRRFRRRKRNQNGYNVTVDDMDDLDVGYEMLGKSNIGRIFSENYWDGLVKNLIFKILTKALVSGPSVLSHQEGRGQS